MWSVAQSCPSLQPYGLYPIMLLCPWGFSSQKYWSGLPFPLSEDLLDPGIKPDSPALARVSFITVPPTYFNYEEPVNKISETEEFLTNPLHTQKH